MTMSRVSAVMCSYGGSTYWHWCPDCEELHPLPTPRWKFDGNLEQPTFTPSFRQYPSEPEHTCHYNITAGQIVRHGDSWHKKNGVVPMVVITQEMMESV